jgi:predicted Fe-Mo cluster-binding NifX family protein
MKIAFSSPNGKTLAGHAGKCPGFVVMEVNGGEVVASERVKLAKDQVFSQLAGPLSTLPEHPLQGIDKLVTQGCGEGLVRRLAGDGIEVIITDADTPEAFMETLAKG